MIENSIFEFISNYCETDIKSLSLHTRILHDLGIDGMDAIDFLDEFSCQFTVDISEFPHTDYFGPESFDPVLWVIYKIFKPSKLTAKPLTIEKLLQATISGKL